MKLHEALAVYERHGINKWNIRDMGVELSASRVQATRELYAAGLTPADIAHLEANTFGVSCNRSTIVHRLGHRQRKPR